jgi:hypothetical protein
MKIVISLSIILACLVLAVVAQPAPNGVYRTYDEAMAAAKQWLANNNNTYKAEPAFKKAMELANTDTEKVDAMLAYAATLPWMMNESAGYGSKRYHRSDEAYKLYLDALKLPGLSPARADEIKLAVADLVRRASSDSMTPAALRERINSDSQKSLIEHARAEYGKLIIASTTPPSVKTRAYIGRSKTYDTSVTFGGVKKENAFAAVADLKAATEVVQAPDEDKAHAYFEIVEIARRVNDANTVGGAYDAITKLGGATPEQKVSAYKGFIELLLGNNMIKASKDKLAEAAKTPGLSNDQRAVLSRLTALTMMVDVDPSDSAALKKNTKAAIAELDRTVAIPKMTDEEKFKTYMATGEYLKGVRVGYPLAVDQLEKAAMLAKVGDDRKAEAQYEIGEAYRINGKNAEAKAAYLKVSNVNPRYHGYAGQRIKEVDALMTAPAKPTQ